MKKILILSAKIILALAALYYVLTNAKLEEIQNHVKKTDPLLLIAAFVLLNLATIFGGLRLNVYLKSAEVKLSNLKAIKLFYIGMFFNIFLPGGIGGDGYLAVKLNKANKLPILRAVRLLLLTRANGLFFLNLIFFSLIWFSQFTQVIEHEEIILVSLLVLQFPVYYFVAGKFLKEDFKTFFAAGKYSLLAQLLGVAAAVCIFKGLGLETNFIDYICLFLVAAIAGVLPLTPGGVGIREFIFFEGAKFAHLDPEFGVANSLIFFAIYFLTAIIGLFVYLSGHEKKPKHEKN